MKKNSTIVIVIVVIIILGVWAYSFSKKGTTESVNNNSTNTIGQTNTPTLFSNSPLSKNAYLISTPTYDANTKLALTGFNVAQKTQADGSNEITLTATNPEYKTQVYTVKPGEKLYFIEAILGDDSGNEDKNLSDDTAVLVDANGYIIGQ